MVGILRSKLISRPLPKASALSAMDGCAYNSIPPSILALSVKGIAVRAGDHPENLPLLGSKALISTMAEFERLILAPNVASTSPFHSSIVKPTSTSRKAPIFANFPTLTPSIGIEIIVFCQLYSLASVPLADKESCIVATTS